MPKSPDIVSFCGDDDGDKKKYFWQGQQASQAARVSSHTSRVSHLLLFLHSSLGESTVLNLDNDEIGGISTAID